MPIQNQQLAKQASDEMRALHSQSELAIAAHVQLEEASKVLEEQLQTLKAENAALMEDKENLGANVSASQRQVEALERKAEALASEVSVQRSAPPYSSLPDGWCSGVALGGILIASAVGSVIPEVQGGSG